MFEIINLFPDKTQNYDNSLVFCEQWRSGQNSFILHTSGSTGQPKPIELSRIQMQASAKMTQKALGLSSDYSSLICLNTNYIAGTMMLVRCFEVGMKAIIVEPSSNPLANLPDDIQIDFAAFVPLQLRTIIDENYVERLNKIKKIIVGGAAVEKNLLADVQQLTVPIYSTYGMTETVSHIALQKLNGENKSDFYEVLDGIQTQTDERGCLKICGAVTNHEWITTNDIVEWKDERHFKVLGRADNIINSGGIKIQLEKVERAIEATNLLSSRFFCWYETDEKLGQKLILVIENQEDMFSIEQLKTALIPFRVIDHKIEKLFLSNPSEGSKPSEGLNLLRNKYPKGNNHSLSQYEIPKKIILISKFAETATGKIDKKATVKQLIN